MALPISSLAFPADSQKLRPGEQMAANPLICHQNLQWKHKTTVTQNTNAKFHIQTNTSLV